MKNFTQTYRLLLLLFCSFLAVSCSSDDEEEVPPLENQMEYDNAKYDLSTALSFDLGEVGFVTGNDTHYGQGLFLTDAKGATDPKVILVFSLFSAGTTGFKTGSFEFAQFASLTAGQAETKYKGKNFFFDSVLLIDLNEDGEVDEDTETFFVESGTVNLSGTAPNYTMDCDVVLANGKTLKAQFTGMFVPSTLPDDDDDDDATAEMRKAPKTISSSSIVPKSFKIR